jgi:hypothetical protein
MNMVDRDTNSDLEEELVDWDVEQDPPPTLETIRTEYDESLFKNKRSDLILPSVGIIFYTVPAVLALEQVHNHIQPIFFSILSTIFILFGVGIYYRCAGESGEQDELSESYEVHKSLKNWPQTFPISGNATSFATKDNLQGEELQILLTEYETITQEARYRDRLINRSTYFALAVLAGFGAVISQANRHELPMLMMLLSLAMFVFAMAIIKYKDARDPLWKRQRDLERLIPALRGKLTTFHTIRTPSRRLLDRFSMSSYLINIYLALTFLSILFYLILVIQLPH